MIALVAIAMSHTKTVAQTLTATLTSIPHTTYAGIDSQFRLDDLLIDGEMLYAGSAYLFCADLPGRSLDEDPGSYPRPVTTLTLGSMEDMEIWNRFSNPQDKYLALAMAYWLVDNYYDSYFLNTANNTNARQYAFGNVLWEIFGDGATSAGLNFATGNIDRSRFGPGGGSYSPNLWGYMNTLLTAVQNSGVTAAYQPTYNILVAHDSRAEYQDYLLLASDPVHMLVVPEPASALLCMPFLATLFRRRRC